MKKSTIILFLIMFLIPRVIWCGTTGKISGKIIDAKTGEPLVGANILIENTSLGAAADLDGSYFIINIPPGVYVVKASYVGYRTVIEKQVVVNIDRTRRLDFSLSPEGVQTNAVVVVAKKEGIIKDLTATSQQINFNQIQKLPVENISDILALQVGMTQDPNGGMHLRGGRSSEIQYIVDGMPVDDPFGGGLAVDVQNNDVQQLEVISGTFNAEYGRAMSGIVNIVTKEGGDKLEGTVNAYSGNYATSHNNLFYNIEKQRSLAERYFEGTLGGPLPFISSTHFFLSTRISDQQGWLYGSRLHAPSDTADFSNTNPSLWQIQYGGDNALVPMNSSRSVSYFGKITSSIFTGFKISYSLTADYGRWKSYDHFNKYNPDYDPTNRNWGYNNLLSLVHVISNSTFQELKLSYYATRYERSVYTDPFDLRYFTELQYNLNVPANIFNVGGVDPNFQYNKSYTKAIKYDLTSQVNKANLIKLGFEFRQYELKEEDFSVRKDPQTNFQLAIDPLTALDHNAYDHKPVEAGAYAQDKVEVKDFILNAGLRFDYFDARTYVPTNLGDPSNSQGRPFDQAFRYVKPKMQLSPRIGFAFPISDAGSLHASFGEFFQMPELGRLYENPGFKVVGTFESFIGNADLEAQKTTSYEIGLQQKLTPNLILDATCYYKDIRNLAGTKLYQTFDQVQYGQYVNYDYGSVWGITLAFDLLQTGMISSNIDYTYQVAEGNGSDPKQAFYDAANKAEASKTLVPLAWDQTHVLNWILNVSGKDWGISTITKFQSGLPYTPINSNLLTTNMQLLNLGRRLSQFNMDLQVYKNFKISSLTAQLFLRVDNVFDQTLPEYFPQLTPQQLAGHAAEDYLNSLYEFSFNPASQPAPRLVELGIKFDY
ncbi:MAG: TonB-dependent receptor [Bacteroidetes bacterium]|nr:TonB-dependent receptor [Bacteroidota bacterium]